MIILQLPQRYYRRKSKVGLLMKELNVSLLQKKPAHAVFPLQNKPLQLIHTRVWAGSPDRPPVLFIEGASAAVMDLWCFLTKIPNIDHPPIVLVIHYIFISFHFPSTTTAKFETALVFLNISTLFWTDAHKTISQLACNNTWPNGIVGGRPPGPPYCVHRTHDES